jgi:hypothetical protein
MRLYIPPEELTIEALDGQWKALLTSEGKRKMALSTYIREEKDRIKQKFAHAANEYEKSINKLSLALGSLGGDLEVSFI